MVALAALAVLSGFVGLRLALHEGDPSIFVLAGDQVADPIRTPANLHVEPGGPGYDGQAFYRFARDPLTRERDDLGISMLRPAYRHQRIGYPLMAWVVAGGGREALTPGALIVVNLAAGVAIAALAATLARLHGRSPWWGLVPAGWAGYLLCLALDLSEVVAGALLLATLLALRRTRWAWAAVGLTAAALTRETTLLLAAAVVATAAWSWVVPRLRWPGVRRLGAQVLRGDGGAVPPAWVGLAPLVVYGAWRVALRLWWGPAPAETAEVDGFLTVPFVRLAQELLSTARGASPTDGGTTVLLLFTLVATGAAAWALRDPRAGRSYERVALVAVLVLFFASPTWARDETFLRWANDSVTLGWLIALGWAGRLQPLRTLSATAGGAWIVTAAAWIRVP